MKNDDRTHIHYRVRDELARGNSCHIRILYLRLCEMAMALFSKEYFKQQFFNDLISLSADIVANVRLKLCTIMPRLKSLLSLPSDKSLLQRLEATVKDLLLRETDADVLFALQNSIQDLDGTETGVDGVPSMNAEEDRDNERKLREERLIASMEEQLYKIHSVQSSPSKSKLSLVPLPATSSAGSQQSSRQRLLPSAIQQMPQIQSTQSNSSQTSNGRRSESLPPPLSRPIQPDLSSLVHQTPEPSRTYSPELSVLKNDKANFFDFSQPQTTAVVSTSWDSLIVSNDLNDQSNNGLKQQQQPYSSSLENLDPSAKEFLVDAGVILDNTLTSASSMPNLSAALPQAPGGQFIGQQPIDEALKASSLSNLEGEFSKYLISNAEMDQYELEYQRCASIIFNGSIEQLATPQAAGNMFPQQNPIQHPAIQQPLQHQQPMPQPLQQQPMQQQPMQQQPMQQQPMQPPMQQPLQQPIQQTMQQMQQLQPQPLLPAQQPMVADQQPNPMVNMMPAMNMVVTTSQDNMMYDNATLATSAPAITYPTTSIMTAIPSTPPMGIPRQQRSGSPTKASPASYPNPGSPPLHPSYQSVGANVTNNVANFAQSTFTNISKLTTGSTDIQGSIERLAEKWEAKRKSLIAVANGSFDFEDGQELETTEIAKQQRATIMEQKLQTIKQQGIPKKRSLLKTPSKTSLHGGAAQKRLSLTDQVEAVGQKAVHKFIIEPNQRRKSMEMMINFSDSGESSSEENHHDKINGKFRGMHLNDRSQQQPHSLPPYQYPSTSRAYGNDATSPADDSMITYVGASSPSRNTGNFSSSSPTHLVVKPVNSNPMMPNNSQRNMLRLPANQPRSLPQPPRSLPMPPTYRQAPATTNSLIRAPSTSLLSNRSVYNVNKPNNQSGKSSQSTNRQLPQPKQRQQQHPSGDHNAPSSGAAHVAGRYYGQGAVLPQPPSPKKSLIAGGKSIGNSSKPISPYIVSVNSPTDAHSPDNSPTSSNGHITISSGSNASTGSSSSQSSNESSMSNGPKYTRVPPPRYRPHQPPLAQRRPISSGHYQQQQHHDQQQQMNQSHGHDMYQQPSNTTGGNLRQTRYGGKSISAESVLVNGQRNANPQKSYDQHYNQKASVRGNSRSSSPHNTNTENQLTPTDDPSIQRNGNGRGGGIPQGPMRRSSGLRMWQGQVGHQSRSTSNSTQQQQQNGPRTQQQSQPGHASSTDQHHNKQNNRSPSPGNGRASSQPRMMHHQQHHKSRVPSGAPDQQSYHRGSSLPGAYQMSYNRQSQGLNPSMAGHSGTKNSQQQSQQRRPNSLHNSPGSSRPSSPQISMHQKRKSSHYPNGTSVMNRPHQPQPSVYSRHTDHHHRSSGGPSLGSGSGASSGESSSQIHRNSLSSLHYSNNAKRQIQQQPSGSQHQKQQQYASRTYSNDGSNSSKMGLPAPGFSSRLPMGVSQRSN